MVAYFSKYLPKLAHISELLRKLSQIIKNFVSERKYGNVFYHFKNMIQKRINLRYFDLNKPVTIQIEYSSFSIEYNLMQDNTLVYTITNKILSIGKGNAYQTWRISLAFLPLTEAPKRLQNMILQLQGMSLQLRRYNLKVKYFKDTEIRITDLIHI